MGRKVRDPEAAGRAALDKALRRVLPRKSSYDSWELFDSSAQSKHVSWGQFHERPNTHIVAITSVILSGKTWWVIATYYAKDDLAAVLMFGFLGGLTLGTELSLEFWDVDPRTLGKPVWDHVNHPDGHSRAYIKSREALGAFLANN